MSDSNDDGIPAWQRTSKTKSPASSDTEATTTASTDAGSPTAEDKLTIAKRFLDDEKVKNEPRDKKVAFLKSKGVEDDHIQKLLGDTHETTSESEAEASSPTPQKSTPATSTTAATDRAPIVTYPEFLTKPQRPPPLVTTQGLLNTLYGFAGLSTLVYGVSRYVAEPMIASLDDARQELHDTTASRLDALIHQLERTVSVVPPPKHAAALAAISSPPASTATAMADDADEDEDPAEMFHRDVGTQTSFSEALPVAGQDATNPKKEAKLHPALQHATGVTKLAKCVSGLRDAVVSQSGDFEDIKAQVEHFREELDRMTFPQMDFTPGSYTMMSTMAGVSKNEPDDEVRKARDNIRRIKGVLLSTRSFPASTR
ncbi:peroxin Pex14/17-Penicillium chrysogenum [Beauveria brongniartii RCEF 3172]|uniref:Peroxisomal membrane protein PEX14 n=1 Tax=Beauveria brongniartii RCEF 3172 TaxID=1081107 RepID=A0A167H4Y8_9HYPO|nr:peroxin Pex14/17-Penicillium chrysogenum [Beauveria brongniartii RCEF 3172]